MLTQFTPNGSLCATWPHLTFVRTHLEFVNIYVACVQTYIIHLNKQRDYEKTYPYKPLKKLGELVLDIHYTLQLV